MVSAVVLFGVSTTVAGSSAAPLKVSLANTLSTPSAPVAGTLLALSSTASSSAAVTVTLTVAVSHTLWFGAGRHTW